MIIKFIADVLKVKREIDMHLDVPDSVVQSYSYVVTQTRNCDDINSKWSFLAYFVSLPHAMFVHYVAQAKWEWNCTP